MMMKMNDEHKRVKMLQFRIATIAKLASILFVVSIATAIVAGQDAASPKPGDPRSQRQETKASPSYSGMYSFLKEGELVQITVEEDGRVTGFISRFGTGNSDKGSFLDQFFKTAKLDDNKLEFTTQIVHGISFDFKGTVERGEGKNPGDEAYYVLKGSLTENSTDGNKRVTSHSQEVAFKMFPQDAK
jgi:hypothetical protein